MKTLIVSTRHGSAIALLTAAVALYDTNPLIATGFLTAGAIEPARTLLATRPAPNNDKRIAERNAMGLLGPERYTQTVATRTFAQRLYSAVTNLVKA